MSGMDRVQQTVADKCSRKQGVATNAAENKVWQNAPGRKEYRRGVRSAE